MNDEPENRDGPPEDLREAVAKHNLAVLVRRMQDEGFEDIVCHFFGERGKREVVSVWCLPADSDEIVAPPATGVSGLLRIAGDGQGGWRTALQSPPVPLRQAAGETCLALLDVLRPGWEREEGATGDLLIRPGETQLEFGQRFEGLDWSRSTVVPEELPMPDAPAEPSGEERRQAMGEAAQRHNLAVLAEAMNRVGAGEILVTVPPGPDHHEAAADIAPREAARAGANVAVPGLLSIFEPAGGRTEYLALNGMTLESGAKRVAWEMLRRTFEEWAFYGGGEGTVAIDAEGRARLSVDRKVETTVREEATLAPRRLPAAEPEETPGLEGP